MSAFNIEINDLAPLEVDLVRIGNKGDGGYLVMTDKTSVPVSTRKRMAVVEMLNSL